MQLKFSIKSSTHYLTFLRRLVDIFGNLFPDLKIDHKAKMSCSLALVEAVNNAIFHAHGKDEDKWIDVAILQKDNRLIFEVHDCGDGFEIPESDVPPVDHVHGRGLFIINSLMNEVEYKCGTSNVLRMVYFV